MPFHNKQDGPDDPGMLRWLFDNVPRLLGQYTPDWRTRADTPGLTGPPEGPPARLTTLPAEMVKHVGLRRLQLEPYRRSSLAPPDATRVVLPPEQQPQLQPQAVMRPPGKEELLRSALSAPGELGGIEEVQGMVDKFSNIPYSQDPRRAMYEGELERLKGGPHDLPPAMEEAFPGFGEGPADVALTALRRAYENVERFGAGFHKTVGQPLYGVARGAAAMVPGGMTPGEGWQAGREQATRIAESARGRADMSEYMRTGIDLGGNVGKVEAATDLASFILPAELAGIATSKLAGAAIPWITRRAVQQMAAAPRGISAPGAATATNRQVLEQAFQGISKPTMMAGRTLEEIASPIMRSPGVRRSIPGQVRGFMGRYAPVDVALSLDEDFPGLHHLGTAMRQEEIAAGGFDPSEHFLSRLGYNVAGTAAMGALFGAFGGRRPQGGTELVGGDPLARAREQTTRRAAQDATAGVRWDPPAPGRGPAQRPAARDAHLEPQLRARDTPELSAAGDRLRLQGPNVSYRGVHEAPTREYGSPLHYDPVQAKEGAGAVDASISPAAPEAGVRAIGSAPAPSPIITPPPGTPLLLTELSESSIKRLGTPPETWSRLRRAIEEVPIQLSKKGEAQAPAWLTAISKWQEPLGPTGVKVSGVRRGVKQEEMDQTGMGKFLREDPTRQLTREDMLKQIDEGELRVSRMTKGKELIRPNSDHVTVEPWEGGGPFPGAKGEEYIVAIEVTPHNLPPGLEAGTQFSGEAKDVGGRPEYQSGLGQGSRFATREEAERFRARILEGGIIADTPVPPAYKQTKYQLGYSPGTRPPDYSAGVEEVHYSVDSPAMRERRGEEELTTQGQTTLHNISSQITDRSMELMEEGKHSPNSYLAWAQQNALEAREAANIQEEPEFYDIRRRDGTIAEEGIHRDNLEAELVNAGQGATANPSSFYETRTPGDIDIPMVLYPLPTGPRPTIQGSTVRGHIEDLEELGWEVKLPEEWSMEQGVDRGVPIMRHEEVERAIQQGDVWHVLPGLQGYESGTAATIDQAFNHLDINTVADLATHSLDDLSEYIAPDIVHDIEGGLEDLGLSLNTDPAELAGPMWRSLADIEFGYGYLPEGAGVSVDDWSLPLFKELVKLLQPRMPTSSGMPPTASTLEDAERLLSDAKLIHDKVVGEAHYGGETYHSDPQGTFQRLRFQERIFRNQRRGRDQLIGTLMEGQSDIHKATRGTEHRPPRRYALEDLPEGSTVTPPSMSLEEEPPGLRVTPPKEGLGEGLPSGAEMSPPKHTFPYDINKIVVSRPEQQPQFQPNAADRVKAQRNVTQDKLGLGDQEMVKHLEAQLPEGSQVVFQELLLRSSPGHQSDRMERPSGEPLVIYRVVLPPEIIERMPMKFRRYQSTFPDPHHADDMTSSPMSYPRIFGRQQSRVDTEGEGTSGRMRSLSGGPHPLIAEGTPILPGEVNLQSLHRQRLGTAPGMVTWLDRDYEGILFRGEHIRREGLDNAYREFLTQTERGYQASGASTQLRDLFDAPIELWQREMSALPPLPEGPIGIFSTVRQTSAPDTYPPPGEGGWVHPINRDIGYPHRVGEPELLLDPEIAPTLAGLRLNILDEVFAWLSHHPDYQWTVELPSAGPTWEGWLEKRGRLVAKGESHAVSGQFPVGVEWFPKDWDEQGLGRQLYVPGGSEEGVMRNARKILGKLPRHETQVEVPWYRDGELVGTYESTGASKADALQTLRDDQLRHQPEYQEVVQLPMRFSPQPISYEEVDVARRVDPRKLVGQWKQVLAGKEPKKRLSEWEYGPHRLAGPYAGSVAVGGSGIVHPGGKGPLPYLPAGAELLSGAEQKRLSGLREIGEGQGKLDPTVVPPGQVLAPPGIVQRTVENPRYQRNEGLVTFDRHSNTITAPAGTAIAEARNFFGGSLPSMPFKSADARALAAIQQMVALSIERGWDGIALINAKQQRRFYRVDDLVSRLEYNPATHTLTTYSVDSPGVDLSSHNVPPDGLEEYIGGIGKKLLEPHNGFEVDGTLYDTLDEADVALRDWQAELKERLERTRADRDFWLREASGTLMLPPTLGGKLEGGRFDAEAGESSRDKADRIARRAHDIEQAIYAIPLRRSILERQSRGVLRAEGDALVPGGPGDVFTKNYGEILPRSVYRYIPEIGGKAADVEMVDLGIPMQTTKTSDIGVFAEISNTLMRGEIAERSVEVARVKTTEQALIVRRSLSDPEKLRAALALAKPHEKEVADLMLEQPHSYEGIEGVNFQEGKYRYEYQDDNTFFEVTPEMKKNYQAGGGGATFGVHGIGPLGGGLAGAMQEAESPEERWENIKRGAKLGLYAEVGARFGPRALKGLPKVPTNRLFSGIPDLSRAKTPSGKPRSSPATTSITPLLSGQEKFVVPSDPKIGRPTIRTAGVAIDERALAANGRVLDIDADRNQIVDAFHGEVLDHLKDPVLAGGKEFYRSDLESAFQRIAQHRPAIAADPVHLEAFRFGLAVTSQGIEVSQNAGYALRVYDDFAKTGRFNTSHGWGTSAGLMRGAWRKWNRLADILTPEDLFRLMDTQLPKGQLDNAGLKVSAELVDEVLPGAVIFGSKIGGGFFHNLGGFYDFPTMDRWFRRAVGRITGTLMFHPSEKAMKSSASRFRRTAAAHLNLRAEEMPTSTEEILDLAYGLTSKWEKLREAGRAKKPQWALAAESFIKNWNPTIRDAPTTGTEKRQLRAIVRDLVGRVPKQDAASIQALIWYPEKQLYRNLGIPVRVDPTYDSSFKEIFDAQAQGGGGAGQGPAASGLDPGGVGETRRLAGPRSTEFREGFTPAGVEEVLGRLRGPR